MDSLMVQNNLEEVVSKPKKKKKRQGSLILNHIEKKMVEASSLVHKNAVSFQINHKQK